jgi:hypothetical protein
MARKPVAENTSATPTVANRWWVDLGGTEKVKAKRPPGPAGSKFFQIALDFEQERARERLTDNNLKVLAAADPPKGAWSYVLFGETAYPERELERIKRLVGLPRYARGVIVDCGRSVRLLVTGTPVGERLLDLTLGEAPSLDCWINQEWVRETVFDEADQALRAFRRVVQEYLSPESIMQYEAIRPRA